MPGPQIVRPAAWVLLFAALGAAAASWFTPTPDLGPADAEQLVLDALAAADVEGEIAGGPRPAEHRTSEGQVVPVWVVEAEARFGARDEAIELRVQRSAGRLVYVDDRVGAERSQRLLDDEQFEALGAHRDDTLADRWAIRNALGDLSALLIAGTCYVLATRADPLWSRS
jgi:hypothetical protein